MDIAFDPAKDAANILKHGVSLAFGARIWDDSMMLISPTIRIGDEEERFKAIGLVEGKMWTAVHVYRDSSIRFLSVRRSNDGEQGNYDCHSG